MSDDLVNQLTLNFLISKNQLHKLNKKIKEDNDNNRISDRNKYTDRIKELFNDLLVNRQPNDLLLDVKSAFDYFIEKCIYFFKIQDNNAELAKNKMNNQEIYDDIDFEKKERNMEPIFDDNEETGSKSEETSSRNESSYSEEENDDDNEDDTNNEDDNNNEDEDDDNTPKSQVNTNLSKSKQNPQSNIMMKVSEIKPNQTVNVRQKYYKPYSTGVDDIQKLPLDWFQSVRQNYKQNHIIPRKKDVIIGGNSPFRDEKKKI
jgi:hypothetical protein